MAIDFIPGRKQVSKDWCDIHEEWLNDVDCWACGIAKTERERIIKLLEFELWETFQKSHNERPAWATMKLLITAIKGENK